MLRAYLKAFEPHDTMHLPHRIQSIERPISSTLEMPMMQLSKQSLHLKHLSGSKFMLMMLILLNMPDMAPSGQRYLHQNRLMSAARRIVRARVKM